MMEDMTTNTTRSRTARRLLACTLGLALAGTLVHPAAAAEPESSTQSERPVRTVRLVIHVAPELGEEAERYHERLDERLPPALEEAGFELVDDVTADASVRVSLLVDDLDNFAFRLETEITVGDQHTKLKPTPCEDCLIDKLYPAIDQQGPRIVDALQVARVRSGSPTSHGETQPQAGDPPPPIGPLGGVGIGVAGLGLAATIAGAVELSKGKRYDADTGAPDRTFVDHRPAGRALLGAGVAAVVVGAALVITDVTLRAKQRRTPTRAMHPIFGEGVVGLGLIQQF
jgi:hypothetical protein